MTSPTDAPAGSEDEPDAGEAAAPRPSGEDPELADLKAAAEAAPRRASGWLAYGAALNARGETAAAQAAFARAQALGPGDPKMKKALDALTRGG